MPRPKKQIRISEHWYAERYVQDGNHVSTQLFYRTDEEVVFGRGLIDVRASTIWTQGAFDGTHPRYSPAMINWFALGSVVPTFTQEFAKAMLWAVREATKLDIKLRDVRHQPSAVPAPVGESK